MYLCSFFSNVSARCARAHARCILRHTNKRDTVMNLRDDWQKKKRRKRTGGEKRSHATSTNVSTWCTTPVHGLSWSDRTLFRGKQDHASRKIKFQLWQLLYKAKRDHEKGIVYRNEVAMYIWRDAPFMKFLLLESSTFTSSMKRAFI